MRGFGGMITVEFNLPLETTKKLIASFKLFSLAESLGGVESLVCHPANNDACLYSPRRKTCLWDYRWTCSFLDWN